MTTTWQYLLHNTINVEVPDAGIFLTKYICKKNEVTQTIQIGQDLSTDKADSRRHKKNRHLTV